MTKKQRRAQRRDKARQARQKAVRRAVATHQHSSSLARLRASVEPSERFEVDLNCTWHVVRTLPRWAGRAAAQIRQAGIPVFEARETVRLVSEVGKARIAQVPILRRLLFVGISSWRELVMVESHPGVLDDATSYRRGGVMRGSDERPIVIPADQLQAFADCITGLRSDVESFTGVLALMGMQVEITEGAFQTYQGVVEAADARTGKIQVSVNIFGRDTPVELHADHVQAA